MPQDERTIGLQTAIRESYDQREVVDRLSLGVRQLAAFLSRFGNSRFLVE